MTALFGLEGHTPVLFSRAPSEQAVTTKHQLVSCAQAKQLGQDGMQVIAPVGIYLLGDDDPAEVVPFFDVVDVVGIDFATFRDGRGYSHAYLLRERYNYKGDVRAIGDISPETIYYMVRCGFTSFVFEQAQDIEVAKQLLDSFSVCYQNSTDEALPLFRRLDQKRKQHV